MQVLQLSKPDRTLRGEITLEGSKSISNRALIVLALAGADPGEWLQRLSTSKDTVTLQRLLTLAVGDIIQVPMPRQIPVTIGGRLFAQGSVGEANGRTAIKIESIQQGKAS